MRHYPQPLDVDISSVVKTVREAMKSSGLTQKVFAENHAEELGLSVNTTKIYLSKLVGGVLPGVTTRTTSREKRQELMDRLASVLYMLRISHDHPVIQMLKDADPGFSYPPTTAYHNPIAQAASGQTKVQANNPGRANALTVWWDYAVLRAVVISTTSSQPSASSELQRYPTTSYAKIKASADPYAALPSNVEAVYPRELVKEVAEGLLLLLSQKSAKLSNVLPVADEAFERNFGKNPALNTLVEGVAADVAGLENRLVELEAKRFVAFVFEGAYVATREGVMAYRSSPISRALFSSIPRTCG